MRVGGVASITKRIRSLEENPSEEKYRSLLRRIERLQINTSHVTERLRELEKLCVIHDVMEL